jgi:hypothetical protein
MDRLIIWKIYLLYCMLSRGSTLWYIVHIDPKKGHFTVSMTNMLVYVRHFLKYLFWYVNPLRLIAMPYNGYRDDTSLYVTASYVSSPYIISRCFTSPYVSSLNKSQPTELHQPLIGWVLSLTYPNPRYGQSQPTELHQPMNWLTI